jgi:hypothetical protein
MRRLSSGPRRSHSAASGGPPVRAMSSVLIRSTFMPRARFVMSARRVSTGGALPFMKRSGLMRAMTNGRRYGLWKPRFLRRSTTAPTASSSASSASPLAHRDRGGERPADPFLASSEDGMVCAAGEPRSLLVREAERRKRRLLELERQRVLALVASARRDQVAIHARHAERTLAEVVRLLDVERQDLVGDRRLGHDERDERLRAELAEGRQAMVAVRDPVELPGVSACLAHRDHGVEEALRLVHRVREPADVRVRDVALERCRRDHVDGQRAEEEHVPAERLAIRGQHGAAVLDHRGGQGADVGRKLRYRELARGELGRAERHSAALPARPAGFSFAWHGETIDPARGVGT